MQPYVKTPFSLLKLLFHISKIIKKEKFTCVAQACLEYTYLQPRNSNPVDGLKSPKSIKTTMISYKESLKSYNHCQNSLKSVKIEKCSEQ